MPIREGDSEGGPGPEDLEPVSVDVNEGQGDEGEAHGEGQEGAEGQEGQQQQATGMPGKRARSTSPSTRGRDGTRYAEMARQVREANERAARVEAALEQERAQRTREIDLMSRGREGQQPDPFRARLSDIREQQSQLVALAVDPNRSPEDRRRAEDRYHQLEDERLSTIVSRHLQEERSRQEQQRPDPQDSVVAMHASALSEEFPEVMASEQYRQQAHWYYVHLVNNEGRREGLEAQREAAAYVAAKRGLGGGRYQPTARDRAATSGVGSRDTGSGQNGRYDFASEDLQYLRGSGLSPTEFARYDKINSRRES
jgi:hypothetical protein